MTGEKYLDEVEFESNKTMNTKVQRTLYKLFLKWERLNTVGRLIYISGPVSVIPEEALFTEGQSEKDGGNKTRMLLHMSLGVISTKHGVRRTNLAII